MPVVWIWSVDRDMQCFYVVGILVGIELQTNGIEKCVKNTLREEIITTNPSQESAFAVFLQDGGRYSDNGLNDLTIVRKIGDTSDI